ncbi:Rieske (2Fe-2S) protein [Methylocystis sp. B8]|uniref:Rieske (2Fe-2S) protein n=1 Tax=Methylocystis sp. B8 TaxID=544938 RepID=UPI0010FEFE9F|nr:Rieske (2Fe-2S) protein [Methylocystis sp. B8]TLG71138.1 Rieske (2Fe-2S) protein [Methylocystis sp. B8]
MSGEVQLFVICATKEIQPGEAKAFSLSRVTVDGKTQPYSIFVVRAAGDQFFGYLNTCPHQGTWLNIGDGRFFSDDHTHLRCGRHKAEFDIESGVCVKGSCKDKALEPIPIVVMDGDICLCGVELSEEEPQLYDDEEFEDTMEIMIHPG